MDDITAIFKTDYDSLNRPITETLPDGKETQKNKYPPRNMLEGVDLEKVNTKLNHFLDSKGFIDEELRLPDFAADLGLSTHQASYYLNQYLNMSFTDFLQSLEK
ncbi:hypothetical protein [Leptospira sp. mild_001]|uniref:hypothetical protein n=1 Tax=Leptospira sp. mild_001 TaxID=2838238 RepID=UPI001E6413FE|nr:hypothetical protein [Leptospira sp. mild_001]